MKHSLILVALSVPALNAQTPRIVEERQIRIMAPGAGGPGAGAMTWMNTEASFEAASIKGVPFIGDFVTENSQTLADGNRIRNSHTSSYARDAEGRTRREVSVSAIGGSTGAAAHKTVFIHDPVASVDFILDPQAKTARKIKLGSVMNQTGEKSEGNVIIKHRLSGPQGAEPIEAVRTPLPPGMVMNGEPGTFVFRRMEAGAAPNAEGGAANYKNESLGNRLVDGVEAEGTRTTLTIPAGQIGNDRPLETVSERWYSNELKTVVMTSRKDPRSGETVYRLTNLRRGQPGRQLFEIPVDYKVIEDSGSGNVVRLRVEKKD